MEKKRPEKSSAHNHQIKQKSVYPTQPKISTYVQATSLASSSTLPHTQEAKPSLKGRAVYIPLHAKGVKAFFSGDATKLGAFLASLKTLEKTIH